MSSHKKILFCFFESSSACLYFFFSSTWFKGFLCLNNFFNLCFQGACKQRQACKQAILVFFLYNGFEIWFFSRRSNSWKFLAKKGKMFSKQHFPSFCFTYILFFQRVCVFVSMSVCVCVCGQACVCLCVHWRQAWRSCQGNKSSSAVQCNKDVGNEANDHTTTQRAITNVDTLRKHLKDVVNDLQILRQSMMDNHKNTIERFEPSHILKSNFCNGVERTRLDLQQWWWCIIIVFKKWFEQVEGKMWIVYSLSLSTIGAHSLVVILSNMNVCAYK